VWWIRQSILKALCDQSRFIRLPANCANDVTQIKKAKKILAGYSNSEVEIRELAQFLNMEESHIVEMLAFSRDMVSLEKIVDAGKSSAPLSDFVIDNRYDAPDRVILDISLKHDIEEVLCTLNKKEADVIRFRYGLGQQEPMTFREIGERFNLTKERIRQIEEKAIMRLQHPSRKALLEAYVA
jgi:RNA polymerase primary sigma factor